MAETWALATMLSGGPGGRDAPPPAWPHDHVFLHAQLPHELLVPLHPWPVIVHPQANLTEPLAVLRQRRDPVDDGNGRPLCVVRYNILANPDASRDADRGDAAERMYAHGRDEHIVK